MGVVAQDSFCGLRAGQLGYDPLQLELKRTSTDRLRSLENPWEKGTSSVVRAAATTSACK
jgi:hypothetical protein